MWSFLVKSLAEKYKIPEKTLKRLSKTDDFSIEEIFAPMNIDENYLKWIVAKSLNKDEVFAEWKAKNDANAGKQSSEGIEEEFVADYKIAEDIAKQVIKKNEQALREFNSLAYKIALLSYVIEEHQKKIDAKQTAESLLLETAEEKPQKKIIAIAKQKIWNLVLGSVTVGYMLGFVDRIAQGPTAIQKGMSEGHYYAALTDKLENMANAHGFYSFSSSAFDKAMEFAKQNPTSKTATSFLNDLHNLNLTTYGQFRSDHITARFAEYFYGTDGLITAGLIGGVIVGLVGCCYFEYVNSEKYHEKIKGQLEEDKKAAWEKLNRRSEIAASLGVEIREAIETELNRKELKPADIAEQTETPGLENNP